MPPSSTPVIVLLSLWSAAAWAQAPKQQLVPWEDPDWDKPANAARQPCSPSRYASQPAARARLWMA